MPSIRSEGRGGEECELRDDAKILSVIWRLPQERLFRIKDTALDRPKGGGGGAGSQGPFTWDRYRDTDIRRYPTYPSG